MTEAVAPARGGYPHRDPATPRTGQRTGQRGEATDAAYQQLYDLAHQLGPNAKLPPVRQLRERFGFSQSTFDAALDRLERQNILVRRERSGVYVAANLRDCNIALLYASHFLVRYGESPFWAQLFEAIRRKAQASQIHLSLALALPLFEDSPPIENAVDGSLIPSWLREDIRAGRIHGVIAVGLQHPVARWIEGHGVPVVAYAGAAEYIVSYSYATLIQVGVATLARQGCRRIALWRTGMQFDSFIESTFVGALAAQGLTMAENGQHPRLQADSSIDVGWQLALNAFGRDSNPAQRPDGILCMSDMVAQGGLMALQRLGVEIGSAVKMATHFNKDTPVLRAWEERIWRIEFDSDELADSLFEILGALLREGSDSASLHFEMPEGYATPPPEKYKVIHPHLVPPDPPLTARDESASRG